MKVHKIVILWIVTIFFCLPLSHIAFGQTEASTTSTTATAHIPYDFWIGETLLPAGDYSISPGAASVVVFWNEKDDVGEQAFLIPTGGLVASGDYKLIFVVHDGNHHLRAVWNSDGKAVLTSEFHLPLEAGDKEIEVKLQPPTPAEPALRTGQ